MPTTMGLGMLTSARRSIAMARMGEAIREARERRRVTLRALAAAIGVSAPFLSDVEHGRRMAMRHLAAIARELRVKRSTLESECGLCAHCDGTGFTPAPPAEGET